MILFTKKLIYLFEFTKNMVKLYYNILGKYEKV